MPCFNMTGKRKRQVSTQRPDHDALKRQKISAQSAGKGQSNKEDHVVKQVLSTQKHLHSRGKGKRKRKRPSQRLGADLVKTQGVSLPSNGKEPVVKQALLAQYYPQVLTLREYLLSKLPAASKIRRRKILSIGRKARLEGGKDNELFGEFLDNCLIGLLKYGKVSAEERQQQWTLFSQRADTSNSTFANVTGISIFSQSEVCEVPACRDLFCCVGHKPDLV